MSCFIIINIYFLLFISKFTPWPKEINKHSSLNMIGQHLLLKVQYLLIPYNTENSNIERNKIEKSVKPPFCCTFVLNNIVGPGICLKKKNS